MQRGSVVAVQGVLIHPYALYLLLPKYKNYCIVCLVKDRCGGEMGTIFKVVPPAHSGQGLVQLQV